MIAAFAAALLGLALSAAAPVARDEPAMRFNAMTMIECGTARGTAFWVSKRLMVSARHVTASGPCTVAGLPVETVHEDSGADFALLRGPDNPVHLAVRCGGFRNRQPYWATGWAQGLFRHTTRLVATDGRSAGPGDSGGLQVLIGEVYPGMSGGPVVDRDGRVVGIVNRRAVLAPIAQSRSLGGTSLCRRPR